jgi:hypothetical protein
MTAPEPLARLMAMLEHVPEPAALTDPRWRPWHVGSGDAVEVVIARRFGQAEVLDTLEVTNADPKSFKLADGRVFDQRGGHPITGGKRSPIRARKVK